jgi:hypothetical protein
MRWIEAVGMSLALLATGRLHGRVLTYLAVAEGVGRGRHGGRVSEGELRSCPNACACRYRSVCPGCNGNRRQVLSLDFYSPSLPTVQPTLNFQVLTDEHGLLQPSAREVPLPQRLPRQGHHLPVRSKQPLSAVCSLSTTITSPQTPITIINTTRARHHRPPVFFFPCAL